MDTSTQLCSINKHVLIAADESENTERAVAYVAHMLGAAQGFTITLINVIAVPPSDFFVSSEERRQWIGSNEAKSKMVLESYRKVLLSAGFSGNSVELLMKTGEYQSIAQVIIDEAIRIGAGTIVLGRRGISKKEEFIYGSTSNKILHSQKSCTALWVVE